MGSRLSLVQVSWQRCIYFRLLLPQNLNLSPKVTFHDGKNFTSKTDYAEKGPQAILEMSASLF
jgi:hypothetical protein